MDRIIRSVQLIAPGFLLACTVALAALFVSTQYGAPSILLALLLGVSFNFLSEDTKCKPGIKFSSTSVLRVGVVFMGAGITLDSVAELGWMTTFLVICAVGFSVCMGYALARLFGLSKAHAVLTAGAVSICGASAAMAISSVLPNTEENDRKTLHTIVAVTTLSTLAMILYPILAVQIGFSDVEAGTFLGATIHDVAQVVGAGFLISEETAQTATIVKLTRVALLVPVVLTIALILRERQVTPRPGNSRPFLPWFLIGFVVLMLANSFEILPGDLDIFLSDAARLCLIVAVAGLGIRTSLRSLFKMGATPASVVVLQSLNLAIFVLIGLVLLSVIQ